MLAHDGRIQAAAAAARRARRGAPRRDRGRTAARSRRRSSTSETAALVRVAATVAVDAAPCLVPARRRARPRSRRDERRDRRQPRGGDAGDRRRRESSSAPRRSRSRSATTSTPRSSGSTPDRSALFVPAVLESAPPPDEDAVHARGAEDRARRHLELRRVEDERAGLHAAEAAVEADQLLERAALVELGVVEAADHDVADVLEAVGAQQVLGRGGRERRERVLALDAAFGEVVGAAGAEGDRAVLGGVDEQPADVGVLAERGQELAGGAPRSPRASGGGAPPSGRRARGCRSRARRRRGRRRRSWAASPACPVASPTARPTIELCSSPPAIPDTSPRASERSTSSSRPYPLRCLNVAPCVCPWSDRTTISYGRGA